MHADLLIVGLGPAGASAAYMAASLGLSVIAVERKSVLGHPVQCAEFIPLPMSRYATDAKTRYQRIDAMHTIFPSGEVDHAAYPGIMIDRARFDQALSARAQANGAKLIHPATLRSLDVRAHRATVNGQHTTLDITYRVLIAADGPHSLVAKTLGLAPLPCLHTRQYTVDLLKPHTATDFWLHDSYPGGYAWLFPKHEQANLGLGVDKRWCKDLKTPLDQLHQHLIDTKRVGRQIHQRTGGAVPVGGLRECLVFQDILFVGDAAGLTHPITGAGIAPAVISGEMAAQVVADFLQQKGTLMDYDEELREQYEPSLDRALVKRRYLESFWQQRRGIDDQTWRDNWVGA